MTKKFIAYSETSGIATSAKTFDSLKELRDLMRWYLAHEWETDRTWRDNIKSLGQKNVSNQEHPKRRPFVGKVDIY